MTAAKRILKFLRDPNSAFSSASDPEVWLDGLRLFATPQLAGAGDHALRDAQVRAWERLANASAGLVLGPPGTGKTHLLAWFIVGYVQARLAKNLPAKVFVSAFTKNAIGNLLDAVARRRAQYAPGAFECVFMGDLPAAGLSDQIEQCGLRATADADGVLHRLTAPAVVLGGSIWSLSKLTARPNAGGDGYTADLFDLICIDEASQMVVSHGLMALAGLKEGGRLVVAGDDRQLPPIRSSREIELEGRKLGGSLYGFMKSANAPECELDETFRLNAPLAEFPRDAFYNQNYRSTDETALKRLRLTESWRDGLEPWEADVLDPDWPVSVLLHDGPPAATNNPFEAGLVGRLASLLADRMEGARNATGYADDLWSERLAIVSPHRAQNAAIRKSLPKALGTAPFVETVDRIQGKERDAVLMSYCVADAEFAVAEAAFIFASERLNVAVTRARSKLILVVSRRLLEAVPNDQELMDKAQLLREFVFGAAPRQNITLRDSVGSPIRVQVRLRGFAEKAAFVDSPVAQADDIRSLTADQEQLLEVIKSFRNDLPYGSATIRQLQDRLATRRNLLGDLSALQAAGRISLRQLTGPHGPFWVAKHLDPPRLIYPATAEAARERLESVIAEVRSGRRAPFYDMVRQRFAWVDPDGGDRFRPVIELLRNEGLLKVEAGEKGMTVDWIEAEVEDDPAAAIPTLAPLADADFELLNALETHEATRINFGIFEIWTSAAELAAIAGAPQQSVGGAIERLQTHGWLLEAADGRLRSRMAELAREVRYVKQRFNPGDAGDRPYLVRSLKVELRNRDKPERSEKLGVVVATAALGLSENHAAALSALSEMLRRLWGGGASIAGFQARSLVALSQAWGGAGGDAFVIAADTGSGKTEAAVLPLIAAAAADRLNGVRGVRAVLAYPRVRLAANQAQRLVGYLAAFASEPGMPMLTVGLQVGPVLERFDPLPSNAEKGGWLPAGDRTFTFPFFACPHCEGDLLLRHGAGFDGIDRLQCTACDWSYDGWVGSKAAMRLTPPDFFLPTTDSLHQWLHDPRYGRLFGDDNAFAAPRALLADEIHLYSHVHGAQVAWTLRRLAARSALNAAPGDPAMLMIGMSATLGDPAQAWTQLSGRDAAELLTPTAEEKRLNPRGREYFYFVQPEVESRGRDITGPSATIQSLMCLAHGMRRRTGDEGGFRSLVFLDSIDKVRRLHAAYEDAENNHELAKLRTRLYPDNPLTGAPRKSCCGQPAGCDAFLGGECWWFAATDADQRGAKGRRRPGQPLRVAEHPVSSKKAGPSEAMIKSSDIIFATSSLEVGYDDPDITLVYQHYAPSSLASFIQRKGRGGRGVDDRPTTGVTLSLYSSRDSWWFRQPSEMIEPKDFDVPLNPDNYFVLRGQLLTAVLDSFARAARRFTGFNFNAPSEAAWRDAEIHAERLFGPSPWSLFDEPNLEALWRTALNGRLIQTPRFLSDIRAAVDWIPTFLFESINLPRLEIAVRDASIDEDVALALSTAAPGNASRRFDAVTVYWRPPVHGAGPWLDQSDYEVGAYHALDGAGEAWLARLPDEARPQLAGLRGDYFRPRRITLQPVGRMFGAGWQGDWAIRPGTTSEIVAYPADAPANRVIRHDSRGHLRGFPVLKVENGRGAPLSAADLDPWVDRVETYRSTAVDARTTGLVLTRVFWGADAEAPLEGPPSEMGSFTQVFTAPDDPRPMLHGYHVQTEGVRFLLNRSRLDVFARAEVAKLEEEPAERRWHQIQLVRYVLESASLGAGINAFDARRAADLMAVVCSDPDLRKELKHLLAFWSPPLVAELFETARSRFLSRHPMLSADRVRRVAEAYASLAASEVLRAAFKALSDEPLLERYVKTATVHALANRLKESFVLVGRGDDRKIVMHVALPLQFSNEEDVVITLCEAGAYGDGTTRTFVDRFTDSVRHWRDGFVTSCPNAIDDQALERFFSLTEHHEAWRRLDPTDLAALSDLNETLGSPRGRPIPPAVMKILFGEERLHEDVFAFYDLAMELRSVDRALAARLGRPPSGWELVSAAIHEAREKEETDLGRLLRAYAKLEDAALDDSLSPENRLGDQLLRVHSRLCVDGCQACVHQASDMMTEGQVAASTSRSLLRRFLCE